MMILKFWKKENLWQVPLASGPRQLVAACPGQRKPTCVRWHRGGSVTAHHLAPALSTARHLRSTRSPCSHRLHVCAAPLSRVAATPNSLPLLFLDSSQAPALLRSPHCLPLPLLRTLPTAVVVVREHRSSAVTPHCRPQWKPSACATE
jgi:hypothetical protein